jgi:histidinol-phosphate aminotransferase
MTRQLPSALERDLTKRGFSRRNFGRIAALLTAGTSLPFYNEPALAQLSASGPIPAGAVKIDANENPMGPCPEAAAAIHALVSLGGRYLYDLTNQFRRILAEQEGLRETEVSACAGSSAPLHQAVIAFTSPERPLVTADPGYEAGEVAARFIGSKVIRVPLTGTNAHDVKAMARASADTGLIYVCNPNNPTGTVTPRAEIEWLIENKPKGAVVLLDEAYIHLAGERPGSDLVAKGKDVIILRTFSKIYGMAGIRAGAVLGRQDLLEKVGGYTNGALPSAAMAAAIASLQSKTVVPERRRIIAEIRAGVCSFLDKHRFAYIESVSNKVMVDVRRPGRDVIMALRQENVFIGRVWPSRPTHVRVSIGTAEEMARFKTAFLKVTAAG